jgi:hypothetical protein
MTANIKLTSRLDILDVAGRDVGLRAAIERLVENANDRAVDGLHGKCGQRQAREQSHVPAQQARSWRHRADCCCVSSSLDLRT